jgi:hypothetical protein
MGYRSEVATVIYGDNRDADKYALLKTLMNTTFKGAYDAWSASVTWHDTKHVLEFRIEDVKWYDGYADVAAFMQMLEEIGEIEGFNYEFLRIGEDDEDIERQNGGEHGDYITRVNRSIEVDL